MDIDWEDLKIASEIHRNGSYAKASAKLGLNETTVSRRLARLEEKLGFKVFQTVNSERIPTDAGRRVLDVARGMSGYSDQLTNLASEGKPIAKRRIASTEPIANHFLAPSLPTFFSEHPHLNIELQLSTDNASFSRWETDLAVRLSRPEKGNIVVRKLASYEWLLVQPRKNKPVFGCGGIEQYMTKEEWALQCSIIGNLPMLTLNGMTMALHLVSSGQCVGFLPSYMCAKLWDNPLLKLESVGSERQVWLLIQEHLRKDPDTRLVTDWIERAFQARMRRLGE